MQKNQRILVIGPAWIGDMVMAQGLFKLLAKHHPHAEIEVAAPAWTLPLLARMPEVTRALSLPFKHGQLAFWQRIALGRAWRRAGYTWAIVLPNSWKSGLVPWAAAIRRRTGWLGEQRWGLLNDVRYSGKKIRGSMIESYMALGMPAKHILSKPYPRPALQVTAASVAKLRSQYQIAAERPILALCPGAEFGSSKRWPAEYYAAVAQKMLHQGWQVLLFGSPKEVEIAEIILQQAPGCVNLIGKTDLGEAIDLLSVANWVLSNDSGLMHIAAALQRKLICFFGATPDGLSLPQAAQTIILKNNLPCQPCCKRTCPLGHHRCMRDIKPQQVMQYLTAQQTTSVEL